MLQKGQTLLEVLVALAAMVVILTSITAVVLSSLKQSSTSSVLTRATQYAQEGIELAKGYSDLEMGKTYCLNADGNHTDKRTCDTTANIGGKFRRQLTTGNAGINNKECHDLLKLTVSVSWTDSACIGGSYCHTIPINTCL
jgi:type II secretory pathway pseudopilin PulG